MPKFHNRMLESMSSGVECTRLCLSRSLNLELQIPVRRVMTHLCFVLDFSIFVVGR